jgi:hypothetical protein
MQKGKNILVFVFPLRVTKPPANCRNGLQRQVAFDSNPKKNEVVGFFFV